MTVHRLRLAAEVAQRVAQVATDHGGGARSQRVVATKSLVEVVLALRPWTRFF